MKEDQKSVSMYAIMAKLFAEIADEVTSRFGKEGEEAIRQAVRTFGERRGQNIAAKAAADGKSNTPENYLPYYDMERSVLFECDTIQKDDVIDQYFHVCPFAQTWLGDGTEKFGRMYCDEIDDALARGYNQNFVHTNHSHLLYGSDCCHMSFALKSKPWPTA
jgi:hypothetical protein